MSALVAAASLALILLVLWDAFEAVLLPRRVTRQLRFARLYYVYAWTPWAAVARRMRPGKRRNTFLSLFGPLSVLGLIGLWAAGLVAGFALLQWAVGSRLHGPDGATGLGTYFYLSGATIFTLGYGDVTPADPLGRALAIAEAGLGFGFLAAVISYLPVLYQAFSGREVTITLLDARAGSPPTAAQLLIRLARGRKLAATDRLLEDWERWAAAVLESHVSFPMLSYFRSQHDNQSWLAALTAALDTSALVLAVVEGPDPYQAGLTFAMARHAVVDLAQVYRAPPTVAEPDRLPADRLRRLRIELAAAGLALREGAAADRKFAELRGMYEPFVAALSRHFLLDLPPVLPETAPVDNWQTSAWMRRTRGLGGLTATEAADDHAD
ncbi:MAG TPA: potassium channel family protein [Isosphaeraceae bacterium]|jgi:voltage-gated potassium channel Kch|nr:potassium channel family protein [Isosphaeraceae bacterium]